MRKITISLIALVLLMSCSLQSLAAGSVSASLSVSNKTPVAGDKVTITVSATVDTCGSGGIQISFDKDAFELVSGDWLLSGTFMKDFNKAKADGVFAFETNKKVSGKVFKFVLQVKSGAALGKETVTVKFKADSTTASKSATITISCDHKYDNKCDTTCNLCNATRKITHTWDKGKVITAANCQKAGKSEFTCKICGEKKTDAVAKTAHDYDNNCDTDCNTCGATRKITHSYAWNCDENHHWQECTSCGDQLEKTPHTLAAESSFNQTGHGFVCTECMLIPGAIPHIFESTCDPDCDDCDYIRPVAHVYRERYTYDLEHHWYACILCDEPLEKFKHIPGPAATETSDQVCTECGCILEAAGSHIHTMGGDWLSDENGHWYQCRCLEMTESEPHAWDEGEINEEKGVVIYRCTVCGDFTAEQYIPAETEPSVPEETMPATEPAEVKEELSFKGIPVWFIAACGLGVSLIINIALWISVAVWRKRAKRDYE